MKLAIIIGIWFTTLSSPVGFVSPPACLAQSTPSAIDAFDETGLTQLMQAAWDGDSNQVKKLLKAGANAKLSDQYGWTALNYAIAMKHAGAVKALLAGGATVNTRDRRDRTPLMWAVLSGKTELITILLADGAEVKAADKEGLTAYSFAVAKGKDGMVKVLRKAGGTGPLTEEIDPNLKYVPLGPIDRVPQLLSRYDGNRVLLKASMQQKMIGTISLRVLIGKDGKVSKVKVIKKMGERVTELAVRLAFDLQSTPPQNDGTAVEWWYPLQVTFGS